MGETKYYSKADWLCQDSNNILLINLNSFTGRSKRYYISRDGEHCEELQKGIALLKTGRMESIKQEQALTNNVAGKIYFIWLSKQASKQSRKWRRFSQNMEL